MAAANTSPICASRECGRSHLCGARWHMRGSRRCGFPSDSDLGLHRQGSDRGATRSGRSLPCPAFRPPSSRRWSPTRSATSANSLPCASPTRAPKRRTSRRRWLSNTRNCRRSSTCSRRRSRAARWCTITFKRNVFLEIGFDGPVEAAARTAPVKVTREVRTARQVMSPIECRGFVAHVGYPAEPVDPARCNAVSARGPHRPVASFCKSRKFRFASSRPTSAAASATRRSWRARKSACAGSRCTADIRCAGWRTGASSSPPTRIAANITMR